MFDSLPGELYELILSHVPPEDIQSTVLAVSRAIPLAPVPLKDMFENIRLTKPEQTIRLYNRVRPRRQRNDDGSEPQKDLGPVRWVKELAVQTWSVDADVLINLVNLLPNLQALTLWVGPNNFAPEHLEELLSLPRLDLSYLSLRFRPYVEKASYYQFLKGSYFDSSLAAVASWPADTLSTLSIVQDPFNPDTAPRKDFAQPIVFFRLDLLPLLTAPAVADTLEHLRIRIPARPVGRSICGGADAGARPPLLPRLEFLDLSTCAVFDAEIDALLARFAGVRHIVLDGCSVLRGDLREGEGGALGKRLALVGLRRAKDREKALKAWIEARAIIAAAAEEGGPAAPPERRPRRGRRGLATATISFRTADTPPPIPRLPPMPLGLDAEGKAKEKKRRQGITAEALLRMGKVRVLPALPKLVSLSLTLSATVKRERYAAIRTEFAAGWADGIAQLAATRARLRTSARNGYRVMRVRGLDAEDSSSESSDGEKRVIKEGLEGLEDVHYDDEAAFGMDVETELLDPPTLCFGGAGRDGAHEPNCGHMVGWVVMKDDM